MNDNNLLSPRGLLCCLEWGKSASIEQEKKSVYLCSALSCVESQH